jgi:uncharacterized protein YcnI
MTMLNPGARALVTAAVLAVSFPAAAHITLENKEAKAGTTVKFVLRVGHGCAGSPTTAVRIAIPEGLANAKPQPKPGWDLAVVTDEEHTGSVESHGNHGAAVKEIAWSGGKLEDAYYDEFVFRASVSKEAVADLYFPIVQECEVGISRWIEIPSNGGSSDDLKFPAPSIKILPNS